MQRAAIGTVKVKGFGPAAAPPGPAPHSERRGRFREVTGGRGTQGGRAGRRPAGGGWGRAGLRPRPPLSLLLPPLPRPLPLCPPFPLAGKGGRPPEPGESPRATRQRVPAFVGRTLARLFFLSFSRGRAAASFARGASRGSSLLSALHLRRGGLFWPPCPVGAGGALPVPHAGAVLSPRKRKHNGRGAASRSDSYACRPPFRPVPLSGGAGGRPTERGLLLH